MESRNIWNAATHMAKLVSWAGMEGETEWQHIGEGSTFEIERAQRIIDAHLPGPEAYLVRGRHDSTAIPKSSAAQAVARVLKKQNIFLCDAEFNHFIEFSFIGVLRLGARNS